MDANGWFTYSKNYKELREAVKYSESQQRQMTQLMGLIDKVLKTAHAHMLQSLKEKLPVFVDKCEWSCLFSL